MSFKQVYPLLNWKAFHEWLGHVNYYDKSWVRLCISVCIYRTTRGQQSQSAWGQHHRCPNAPQRQCPSPFPQSSRTIRSHSTITYDFSHHHIRSNLASSNKHNDIAYHLCTQHLATHDVLDIISCIKLWRGYPKRLWYFQTATPIWMNMYCTGYKNHYKVFRRLMFKL